MKYEFEGKIYIFELGLIGLIRLDDSTEINRDEYLEQLMYYGLVKYQKQITIDVIKKMIQDTKIKNEIIQHIQSLQPVSIEKFEELEQRIVGEVGLSLSDFYYLTEKEADLIYQGYLERKELEANLMVISLEWFFSANPNNIELADKKDYQIGTEKERQQTFQLLGLEVIK